MLTALPKMGATVDLKKRFENRTTCDIIFTENGNH